MDEMQIFVSHNNADSRFATKLADSLREAGADVWYDEHNLGLTDQITPAILQEIRRRRVFIVVVSDDSLKSKWVEKECLWYYREREDDPPRVILPILINGVDPRHLWVFLKEFRRIEGLPHDEAINRVIDMLNREVDSYYPRHVIEATRLRYEQVGGVSSNLSGPRLTSREAAKPRISPQGSRGYRRYYKGKASIYWSERGGHSQFGVQLGRFTPAGKDLLVSR